MKIDAHIHLSDLAGKIPDLEEMMEYLGVFYISSCDSHDDFEKNVEFRRKYPSILVSFGIHPWFLEEEKKELVENLASDGKIDAIGEIGFDRYRAEDEADIERQIEFFRYQMEIASRYNLPVIIHSVKCTDLLFAHTELMKRVPAVIFHSWSGTGEEARRILERGVNGFFSFGTALLKKRKRAIKALQSLPLENIVLETDAPYLPPEGEDFTRPETILRIYEETSRIKGMEKEALEMAIEDSFRSIFPSFF